MRILLDIPDSDIPKKQEVITVPIHFIDGTICEAGGFGFYELSKGYGRLIDADILDEAKEMVTTVTGDYKYAVTMDDIRLIPTIIEADK